MGNRLSPKSPLGRLTSHSVALTVSRRGAEDSRVTVTHEIPAKVSRVAPRPHGVSPLHVLSALGAPFLLSVTQNQLGRQVLTVAE